EQIRGETLPGYLSWLPEMPFDKMAERSIDFWLQSEDLPRPENRIRYDGDRVVLDIREGNEEAARRLRAKLQKLLRPLGAWPHLIERRLYFGKDIPIGGTAHQAGTCRFGTDPASSVLDLDCKAHELDNLYIFSTTALRLAAGVAQRRSISGTAHPSDQPRRVRSRPHGGVLPGWARVPHG
ncbi:MAG: GMC oxidoreductase, partial [Bradyrhizobium sp.]